LRHRVFVADARQDDVRSSIPVSAAHTKTAKTSSSQQELLDIQHQVNFECFVASVVNGCCARLCYDICNLFHM